MTEPQCTGRPLAHPAFTTTHWSIVLNAADSATPESDKALGQLCETYWYPLYVYVRRQGYSPDDAKDLTQEFFGRLLKGNFLRGLDRRKGKFRSFLLGAMAHFLAKHWRDSNRLKRGGGCRVLSLDDDNAELRYQIEAAQTTTAEHMFERRWALTVIEQALGHLRDEFAASGKLPQFEALQSLLSGEKNDSSYAELGVRLQMTEGAVKVAVHRLRARYGELVRAEIARTVASPDEVDQELRYLLEVIGR